MPTDTTVKFLHSGMTGAPVLSGTAGALASLLDAVLSDGWGSASVDSIVIASGVATVSRAAGHPFGVGQVAEIAGASVTGGSINGQRKVTFASGTTYKFDATGIPDQTATTGSTITHKVAALGWTKLFTGTNLRAYQSPNIAATARVLRLDDTGTTNANVRGYASMSDVNTGLEPFPTVAQAASGAFWGKSATADSTARPWIIVGDDRAFYIAVAFTAASTGSYSTQAFGDFASNKTADAYACCITGPSSSILGSTAGSIALNDIGGADPANSAAHWNVRGASGLGTSQLCRRSAVVPVGSSSAGLSGVAANGWMAYPNPADGGLHLSPVMILEVPSASTYRGRLAGVYFAPQQIGATAFNNRDLVTGVMSLPSRTLMAVLNNSGPTFYDVTGPWAR